MAQEATAHDDPAHDDPAHDDPAYDDRAHDEPVPLDPALIDPALIDPALTLSSTAQAGQSRDRAEPVQPPPNEDPALDLNSGVIGQGDTRCQFCENRVSARPRGCTSRTGEHGCRECVKYGVVVS
jgi:hypothetical protein